MIARILFAFLLAVCGFSAHSQGRPVSGKDYVELPTAQATETGSKIEVVEFFWYQIGRAHV